MVNWLYNSQIKDFVGLEPSYTAQDSLIAQINATTTQTLENLLGRTLAKTTQVEYINSKYNSKQYVDVYGTSESGYGYLHKEIQYTLKNFPVDTSETFTIEYRPGYVLDGAPDLLLESDYVLDDEKGTFVVNRATVNYPKGFKVTYTSGYDSVNNGSGEFALSPNLPADLVQAALWQSAHVYEKTNLSNINVRESRGQGSTNSTRYVNINAISPEAMAVIVQNKRRFFTIV
jgi:hypothetical protein